MRPHTGPHLPRETELGAAELRGRAPRPRDLRSLSKRPDPTTRRVPHSPTPPPRGTTQSRSRAGMPWPVDLIRQCRARGTGRVHPSPRPRTCTRHNASVARGLVTASSWRRHGVVTHESDTVTTCGNGGRGKSRRRFTFSPAHGGACAGWRAMASVPARTAGRRTAGTAWRGARRDGKARSDLAGLAGRAGQRGSVRSVRLTVHRPRAARPPGPGM